MMTADEFWTEVDDSAGPTECWPWKQSPDTSGYGRARFDGKRRGAHRVAFFLTHGYWPPVVRHSCDNPPCCNPLHLLWGTKGDNNRDTVARGRHRNQHSHKR